jgi:hypothetical protein
VRLPNFRILQFAQRVELSCGDNSSKCLFVSVVHFLASFNYTIISSGFALVAEGDLHQLRVDPKFNPFSRLHVGQPTSDNNWVLDRCQWLYLIVYHGMCLPMWLIFLV